MRARGIIHTIKRYVLRLRRASTVVSLLVLLSLGLLEPLLCIIHCEIAALHAEAHHDHMAANYLCTFAQQATTKHQLSAKPVLIASTALPAHLHATASNERGLPASGDAQPQPFHEMALITVMLLILVAVQGRRRRTPLHAPPQRFLRPPLRPPTASLRWKIA